MAPTLGRPGVVVGCDAQGDYLVEFDPKDLAPSRRKGGKGEDEGKGKGKGEEEEEEEEEGARKGSVFFGSATPRLPVSFYYPPQALRLVSGGEPTLGARVRVRLIVIA
jgi:hypothetical protein